MRYISGVLGEAGGRHPRKWVPWPSLPDNTGDNPGRLHIDYPLQCGCQKCGAQMAVHYGRGRTSHSKWSGACGGVVHGDVLHGLRPSWVEGPIVEPSIPQRVHWNLPMVRNGG